MADTNAIVTLMMSHEGKNGFEKTFQSVARTAYVYILSYKTYVYKYRKKPADKNVKE